MRWSATATSDIGSVTARDTAGLLGPAQVSADLEAIRLGAGVEQWQVAGHSLSGWHALRYAADHPQRTTSVVALNSVGGCLTPDVLAFLAEFAAMAATWTTGDELTASESFSPAWAADHPAEVALYKLLRDLNPPPRRGVPAERVLEAALSPAQVEALAGVPVLCVSGELDPYAPPAPMVALMYHGRVVHWGDGSPPRRCADR